MYKLPIYAHRGWTKHEPENTLEAMKEAMIQTAADGIEFDLQLTKDRIAIVTHDLNLKRMLGISKCVNDCTLNEIRSQKIKGSRHCINTFSELLAWAIPNKVPMNIELKESFIGRTADLEIVVKKTQHLPNVHYSSFHLEVLQQVKVMNPAAEVAFIPKRKFDWASLNDMPWIDALHVNKHFFYKEKYWNIAQDLNKVLRFYSITGKEKWLQKPQHPSIVGWITDEPNRVADAQRYVDSYVEE